MSPTHAAFDMDNRVGTRGALDKGSHHNSPAADLVVADVAANSVTAHVCLIGGEFQVHLVGIHMGPHELKGYI